MARLALIHDMRRNLWALRTLADAGELSPRRFGQILAALTQEVDSVEAYLDGALVTDRDLQPRRRPPARGPRLAYSRTEAGGAA